MSDVMRFASKDIKSWLERETGSIFVPVHTKAQKWLDEIRRALGNLAEVSKMLLDNSGKEIEKRNMKTYRRARALNRLARIFYDRAHQIEVPSKVSYDDLDKLAQEMQKAFVVTEIDVRNWFPRISPFFILDRRRFLLVFEKAKETLKELQNFLTKEYVKTRTLEETFRLIDGLLGIERKLTNLSEQEQVIGNAKASVDRQMGDIRQRMEELRNVGNMGQLSQTGTQINELSIEVKQGLQHLQKPFIKLLSLATHGEGSGLTPAELGKLNQYLETPFDAFSTESDGYPLLRQILQKLKRSISEGKLKLKPEKARKAEQTIGSILDENSLESLHRKCNEAMARRTQLSTSAEVAALQLNLSRLQEQLEDFARRKNIIETEESSLQKTHNEVVEKISNHKDEIERNILSFASKKIQID